MSGHRPPTMRGRGRAKYRDQNSPSPTPGYQQMKGQGDGRDSPSYNQSHGAEEHVGLSESNQSDVPLRHSHTPSSIRDTERGSASQDRPRKGERSKNRRPDVQVYVPRARRSQAPSEQKAASNVTSPNRPTVSNIPEGQRKVKPEKELYVPKPREPAQRLEDIRPDQLTKNNSPPELFSKEHTTDSENIAESNATTTTTETIEYRETEAQAYGNKKFKAYDRRKQSHSETLDYANNKNVNLTNSGYNYESKHEKDEDQTESGGVQNASNMQDITCDKNTATSYRSTHSDDMSKVLSDKSHLDKVSYCKHRPFIGSETCLCENLGEEYQDDHVTVETELMDANISSDLCDNSKEFSMKDGSEELTTNQDTDHILTEEGDNEVYMENMKQELKSCSVLVDDSDLKIERETDGDLKNYSCNESQVEVNYDTSTGSSNITSKLDMAAVDREYSALESDSVIPEIGNTNSHVCDRSQDDVGIETEKSILSKTEDKRIANAEDDEDQVLMNDSAGEKQMDDDKISVNYSDNISESQSVEVSVKQSGEMSINQSNKDSNDIYLSDDEFVSSVNQSVSKAKNSQQLEYEEPDEDSWDAMFNDDGDCLDPTAMEELTRNVGKVKIEKTKKINYLDYQPKDKGNFDYSQYAHIIEIYDFPKEFVTRDLITAFQSFMSRGFDLKWVDDTHALGIFSSNIAAQDALDLQHPLVKVCPLSQASRQSKEKARRCTEFLQPYKPRPETSAMAARRLVAGALGIATNVSREKRDRERQQLREAKEKRRKDRKNREDIWEYGKCAMDEES